MNSKDSILHYLADKSIEYVENKTGGCDTNTISTQLYLSRSTISQYLNALAADALLIKIKARPVIFLHKEVLETTYIFTFEQTTFEDESIFFEYFAKAVQKRKNFSKEIGCDTSLRYPILQCQSAITYPPHGIPVLLIGEKGCGKKLLSQHMYEYLIDEKIFTKKDPYIIFNCNLETSHETKLFGYIDEEGAYQQGILQKMTRGLIYINHCEHLSESAKERIKSIFQCDKGILCKVPHKISKEIRFVFSYECNNNDWQNEVLFQSIPISVNIPTLEKRLPEDKKRLIYTYIKSELTSITNRIFISSSLLQTLLNTKFERNIDQLKNVIKVCCANAFSSKEKAADFILYQYHLPTDLLSVQQFDIKPFDRDDLIPLENLNKENELSRLFYYYEKILSLFESHKTFHTDEFYQSSIDLMNEYFDFMVFNQEYSDSRVQSIEKVVDNILKSICSKYKISLPANFAFVVARIIYLQLYYSPVFLEWEREHQDLNILYQTIYNNFKDKMGIIMELDSMIYQTLDLHLDKTNTIFLVFYISLFNKNPQRKYIPAIILSHGYSTASSIADTCNRLLNKHIFEAIDMPLTTSIEDIAGTLSLYFSRNYVGSELILLVDMGSLEKIGNLLKNISNTTIGIINNISTKIVLDIGYKVIQNVPMQDILKQICAETVLHYEVFSNLNKENAIIFTTENGITTTNRMIQLFQKSIPNANKIRIMTCDYYKLIKNKMNDKIFEQFNVLFVTGTLHINFLQIPFIPLEDFINLDKTEVVNQILSTVFSKDEINQFNQNLIKFFSMESILSYITILNPDTLFNLVVNAVNRLENKMNTTFSNKAHLGMYIHISCLIERLVTKTAINDYENISGFQEQHRTFIDDINESFSEISTYYNVKIPTTEIAYLFDYINNN